MVGVFAVNGAVLAVNGAVLAVNGAVFDHSIEVKCVITQL